jgi:hypothetical protein
MVYFIYTSCLNPLIMQVIHSFHIKHPEQQNYQHISSESSAGCCQCQITKIGLMFYKLLEHTI